MASGNQATSAGAMGVMLRQFDHNRWLERGLYWLLMSGYGGGVYGLVTLVVTWPLRPLTSLNQVPWWASLLALLLVLSSYWSVSHYLRQGVHHLVYGQHDDAYAIVTRVSDQLLAEPESSALLPTLASTLADTLQLPYVAIHSSTPGASPVADPHLIAVHGAPPAGVEIVTIPLRYRTLALGTLSVSARRSRDSLSAADERLLAHLAQQVGITLHAAQLTVALQSSRQQLVLAREEERRRIRRDLHDQLGPALAALRLQLGALRRSIQQDPAAAETLIPELQADVRAATAEIRRIVYDLRPPMLDEYGLLGVLRNLNPGESDLHLVFDLPDTLPPLPAAVEVALYRIASEALHNVVRHAHATTCTITLTLHDEHLALTITDNGIGLPPTYLPGVGHQALLERAEELGGSATITAAVGGGTQVSAICPWKGVRLG